MRRNRRSIEEWREIIKGQETSGLSASAYCAKHGVSAKFFYRKREKLRQATAGFIEVPRQHSSVAPVVVEACGMRVKVYELSALGAVMATLRGAGHADTE